MLLFSELAPWLADLLRSWTKRFWCWAGVTGSSYSYGNHNIGRRARTYSCAKRFKWLDDSSKVAPKSCALGIIFMNLKITLRSAPALHERHCRTGSVLPSTSTIREGKKKKRLPQIVRWVCCLLPTLRWPTRKGCASRCCMQQMDERSRCYCSAGETFKLLRLWRPWRIRRDVISTVIFTTAKDEISLLNSRQASFAAAVETWLLWHSESHSSDSKTNDNCFPLVSSNKGRVELCCEIKLCCNEEHICTY